MNGEYYKVVIWLCIPSYKKALGLGGLNLLLLQLYDDFYIIVNKIRFEPVKVGGRGENRKERVRAL